MELTHRFSVPRSVEDTWDHFQDIAGLAACFPGAAVDSVDGDSFTGSAKVKLGPIALTYTGSGTFVEKDHDTHAFVVEAKGRDKRGNGTAGATVRLSMTGDAATTDVEVITDLAITGKPAQFGRGVMQDVSDKLLGQFVTCLEQRLAVPDEGPPAPSGAAPTPGTVPEPGDPHAAAPTAAPAPTRLAAAPPPAAQDDALDLGAAVLPVLLKSYWKQGVGALVVLLVLRAVLRRRCGD